MLYKRSYYRRTTNANDLVVALGVWSILVKPKELRPIKKIHLHPYYKNGTSRDWAYDLALIELQ